MTLCLEGRCSIQLSYGQAICLVQYSEKHGRGEEIRTPDILLPKQARYQTALHPEEKRMIHDSEEKCQIVTEKKFWKIKRAILWMGNRKKGALRLK